MPKQNKKTSLANSARGSRRTSAKSKPGSRRAANRPDNRSTTASSRGDELLERLRTFSDALKSSRNWNELGKKVTVRQVQVPLGPSEYGASDVLAARQSLGVSQAIFAQFLGVSLGAVRDWEQSLKPPNGAARRLMDEIRHNPKYFARRLAELARSGNNG